MAEGITPSTAWWRDVRVITAVLGSLVGVAGLAISYGNLLSEEPRLKITVERYQLTTPESNAANIPEMLEDIESEHGAITGKRVIDLRDAALRIDFSPSTTDSSKDALGKLLDQVQADIKYFDAPPPRFTEEQIILEGTKVLWPDGTRVDLAKVEGERLFPSDLVEKFRAAPNAVSPQTLAAIREYAFALLGSDSPQEERDAVAAGLRRVKGLLTDIIDRKNRHIGVLLTLHNRSKLPNYVLRRGLLRVCRSAGECVDVQLQSESGVLIESFSVKSVKLVSQRLDQLNDKDRMFVETGLAKEYRSFIVLQDVNLRTWSTDATFTEIGLDASVEPLAQAADVAAKAYWNL